MPQVECMPSHLMAQLNNSDVSVGERGNTVLSCDFLSASLSTTKLLLQDLAVFFCSLPSSLVLLHISNL